MIDMLVLFCLFVYFCFFQDKVSLGNIPGLAVLLPLTWPWLLDSFVTVCFYPVLHFDFLFLFLLLSAQSLSILLACLPPINPRWGLES